MNKKSLWQKLELVFSLDKYRGEDERRIARILLGILAFYVLSSLIVMYMAVSWGGVTLFLALCLGCAASVVPLFFLVRGNLSASSMSTVGMIIIFVTVYATFGYGLRDYAILGYPAAIVFAGLVEKHRGLILSTILVVLSIIWLVVGEIYGVFTVPSIFTPTWLDLFLVLLAIGLLTFEVNLLVTYLMDRLTQLHSQIAERQRAEEAIFASREVIRNINNNLASGLIYQVVRKQDGSRKFTYLSDSVKLMYGVTPQEGMAEPGSIYGRVHPDDMQRVMQEEEEANRTLSIFRTETRMLNPDGSVRWSSFISNPKLLEDGSTCWDGIELDITERKRAEETLQYANRQLSVQLTEIQKLQAELREQTLRDPLTDLYNRRYLDEALSHEVSRAGRENKPISLIMLDLDMFKHINDTYGHPVGDLFLVEIADLLKQHVRGMDTACRYGGEEFLLMLPGATSEDAFKRAEEIRAKCEAICVLHEDKELRLTISLGIATFPIHGMEANNILIKADKAMYRSKSNGRNKTTIWSE